MADSEMRALGVMAKFGNAFAKQGGSLDMLNWLAENPPLTREVVELADRRLLDRGDGLLIKWGEEVWYNPAECFQVGDHDGVTIAEIEGRISPIAPDERRRLPNMDLVPYLLRRDSDRCTVYGEMHERRLEQQIGVDHLWAAFLDHHCCREISLVLATDGKVNEFYVPHRANSNQMYFPVQVSFLEGRGWKIRVGGMMGPDDSLKKGTHFILDGNKNPRGPR